MYNCSLWARFWSQVDVLTTDECWEYTGAINSTGRGNFSIGHKTIKAHRMAWILVKGEIPDGLCVLHHCDNGRCCNLAHLFLGTKGDNNRDRAQKGRSVIAKGEDSARSKLTTAQVLQIIEKYNPAINTMKEIGKEYGIQRTTVSAIIHGYSWKSVTLKIPGS